MGELRLHLNTPTKEINPYKQSNGVAPNFVHSMDASHLMKTVLRGSAQKLQNWAVIHDSYGTHASDTPVLASALREAFCSLYAKNDVLLQWKTEIEKRTGVQLPPLPEKGDLDIMEVRNAPYFFG